MTAVTADGNEFDSFIRTLRSLGNRRLILLGGTGLAMVVLIILLTFVVSRPQFSLLYSDLPAADSAKVVAEIEGMGIPVKVDAAGTSVLVPERQLNRVRVALAGQGLPASGTIGYELFDERGSLGLTSFMQQVNRVRALEGELARTIQTLDVIEAARVHLVLSERDAFTRERTEPSASVVVRVRRRGALGKTQAQTVRHLVAAAVPGLEASRVTVLDARGNTLLSEDEGAFAGAGRLTDRSTHLESSMIASIERLLVPRLGPGNVRVQANVSLTTEREVVREQIFDPSRTALRSNQIIEETEESREQTGNQAATVEQNIPEADVPVGDGETNRNDLYRTEETSNYEVSSVARERVREPGEIDRVTVAVVVNGSWVQGAEGEPVYTPRSQEELTQIAALVKSAIGFDEERGDKVTIENLQFVDLETDLPPVGSLTLMQVLAQNLLAIIQWTVFLIITVLVLVVGVRPMLARLMADPVAGEPASVAEGTHPETPALPAADPKTSDIPQLEAPSDSNGLAQAPVDVAIDQMMEIRAVKGEVRASSIRKLGQIVDQHPDEMLAIIRSWIHEEAA